MKLITSLFKKPIKKPNLVIIYRTTQQESDKEKKRDYSNVLEITGNWAILRLFLSIA